MRTIGIVLMGLGLLIALVAFGKDTTVYSSPSLIGGSYVGGGSTHNLGLLQQQMMLLQIGLAAFIGGTILYGFGTMTPSTEGEVRTARTAHTYAREDETEDEREGRLAGVRRAHWIMGSIAGGLLLLFLYGLGTAT